LIGTSTNQAFVPIIKNFRVIALAWYGSNTSWRKSRFIPG
jgi:hypothetical protein